MGIIVKNLSSSGFSNVRMGNNYFNSYNPFGDNSQILLQEYIGNVLDTDYKTGDDITYNSVGSNISYGLRGSKSCVEFSNSVTSSIKTDLQFGNSVGQKFTTSIWVELSGQTLPLYSRILDGLASSTSSGFVIARNGNNDLRIEVDNSSLRRSIIVTDFFLRDHGWYNIIVTKEDILVKVYINGILEGQMNTSLNVTNRPLWVGLDNFQSLYPWRGKLDMLRIFNRALSEEEIDLLYNYDL